ncbi:hypothetical protein N601_11550 [Rhodococcus erythropolis DN1]|jgi:hypothetical protein|nr:hypothetical protein N601_11550 [Rhodococcus erythropolis DN1]
MLTLDLHGHLFTDDLDTLANALECSDGSQEITADALQTDPQPALRRTFVWCAYQPFVVPPVGLEPTLDGF